METTPHPKFCPDFFSWTMVILTSLKLFQQVGQTAISEQVSFEKIATRAK
jgi:hypothetical protein